MFTTARTNLRAYTAADIPIIISHVNNIHVQSTLISDPVVPRSARFAVEFEKIANEALLYVIIEATDKNNTVIGAASLTVVNLKNREVAFGIGIHPDYWNQGYGLEVTQFIVDYAFRNLGVHRVSLGVFANNAGAVALYKKIGFVEEGVKRKANWFDGKWNDSIYMGVLEEEWFAKSQVAISKSETS